MSRLTRTGSGERRASARMAGPKAGLDEDGRMQPAAEVPDLPARSGQFVARLVHIGLYVRRDPVADIAQHQRQGDQPLLGAVVQVPLDPAAGLVAGRDNPGPGGGQLGLRLRVGDRGGDQLGEVGQPLFDVGRRGGRAGISDGHDAPQLALHADRYADSGAEPPPTGSVSEVARGVVVVVDPRCPARLKHQCVQVPAAEAHPIADRHRPGSVGPGPHAHGSRRAVPVAPAHACEVGGEHLPDLRGDRDEDLLGQFPLRDERGHPLQRGLLVRQPGR